jgi:hypothetical protein
MQFAGLSIDTESVTIIPSTEIMMVMAYTNDYTIGTVCQLINEKYARQHGYAFHADVQSPEEVLALIVPKLHCTWYKIFILLKLMKDSKNQHIKYFFWIDGDALILHMEKPLQEYILKGNQKELIIAEDMHTCCFINAGVFFLKNCEWSVGLLEEMWASTKYDEVFYYEQSALIKSLKQRKERLNFVRPFHSFVPKGPQGVKFFRHVAVFPHPQFSSNIGITKTDLESYAYLIQSFKSSDMTGQEEVSTELDNTENTKGANDNGAGDDSKEEEREGDEPTTDAVKDLLVYHAAGLRHKLDYFRVLLVKYKLIDYLTVEEYESIQGLSFKLNRNKLGQRETNSCSSIVGISCMKRILTFCIQIRFLSSLRHSTFPGRGAISYDD